MAFRSAILFGLAWLALGPCPAARGGGPALPASRQRSADMPFVGVEPLDPFAARDRDPRRLERLADLGPAFVRTTPIPWGALEPQPQVGGTPRYAWKELDEAILVWQLTGLRPVLVLTPESAWAALPPARAAWIQTLRKTLAAPEAAAAARGARGATPPRPGMWARWERFVRDVVERYDGDGRKDMPGLRRPVRHLQVLDRLTPGGWLGTPDEYLRLLDATGRAAKFANPKTRVLTAGLDVRATGHAPYPDRREWDYRIGQLVPAGAPLVKLETERAFRHVRRVLEMPRLYDALVQVGSAHIADDVANLRFLRRALDERGGTDTALWLVRNPTRKLGVARAPGAVAPKAAEVRLRARWLPVALQGGTRGRPGLSAKRAKAEIWLRRGQAFDLVRGLGRARAAGADVVSFLSVGDGGAPSDPEGKGQGFLVERAREAPAAGYRRTASFWALKQALRLLGTQRSAGETPIGAPGRSVVFRLASEKPKPWVALLTLDSRLSWAGTPGEALPLRDVLVALPSGRYVLESCRLGPEPPTRRTIEVRESMVRLTLSPAPLYVIPARERGVRDAKAGR